MRETIDKLHFVKIKKFYITKITPQGNKSYTIEWKKIFKTHISDKRLKQTQ